MFSRATITLGIGPHSSFVCFNYCHFVVCFCSVRFSFFSTKPRDWLGRMSLKWSSVEWDINLNSLTTLSLGDQVILLLLFSSTIVVTAAINVTEVCTTFSMELEKQYWFSMIDLTALVQNLVSTNAFQLFSQMT